MVRSRYPVPKDTGYWNRLTRAQQAARILECLDAARRSGERDAVAACAVMAPLALALLYVAQLWLPLEWIMVGTFGGLFLIHLGRSG